MNKSVTINGEKTKVSFEMNEKVTMTEKAKGAISCTKTAYLSKINNIATQIISTEEARELQKKLTYGRGITQDEFDKLKEFRKVWLRSMGENPDHYNLGSRNCDKKFGY